VWCGTFKETGPTIGASVLGMGPPTVKGASRPNFIRNTNQARRRFKAQS